MSDLEVSSRLVAGSGMVERVAGALWERRFPSATISWPEALQWYRDGAANPDSCVHHSNVAVVLADARAALTAMLEPTEGMVEAGAMAHDSWSGPKTIGAANAERNARQIIKAALKAALVEGE